MLLRVVLYTIVTYRKKNIYIYYTRVHKNIHVFFFLVSSEPVKIIIVTLCFKSIFSLATKIKINVNIRILVESHIIYLVFIMFEL